jgi:phenylpropionate dioxygenase-like ring-hydroxylating dioxygenase large terminal subunit
MSAVLNAGIPEPRWPAADFTQVPFSVHVEPGLFELEQQRLFHGPTWNYLGLEAEIPNVGDFVSTYVGTTPVVLNRGKDGKLHAFVNRCAHRGAAVVREKRGNAATHTCIYHQWSYDHTGGLVGIPYRRGINGNGGYPQDFKPEAHCLQTLRVESYRGVVFGTFAKEMASLVDYMGEPVRKRFDALCSRPIKVVGYQRQLIRGNWKLYVENLKDCYHGALLHAFNSKFGMFRTSQRGSIQMAQNGLHCVLTTYGKKDEKMGSTYAKVGTYKAAFQLEAPEVVEYFEEHADGMVSTVLSMFPTFVLAQIANHLGFRHIIPKSVHEFELVWINFVYADDSEDHLHRRRMQGNLLGPGGYLSMEDAEALELAHATILAEGGKGHAFVEMGGREFADQDHLVTEVPIRTFWKGYCDLMGMKVEG